jgi:hydroxymethylglutaryl-CoA reductase
MESNVKSSRIGGFHKLDIPQRVAAVAGFAGLDEAEQGHLLNTGNLPSATADRLIENFIGTMNIPMGIATNMKVDGRDRLIPMATEESSVVAAVCNAARQCYDSGGFITSMSGSLMIAQIQLVDVSDPQHARIEILERKEQIRELCDACDPILVKLGGGFRDLDVRVLETRGGVMVITHLVVDTRDAMGANAVNTMAEKIAPMIAAWTNGRTNLRILSNLADRRLARARCVWRTADIGGEAVRDGMLAAYHFADADPYRAATHNKGIMNGVDAVVIATGNDWRAIEAGAHAYAARNGRYTSLSTWGRDEAGNLVGELEMPMAVGIVGGATRVHPAARAALKLMGIQSASELAGIIVSVGLAQNLAALRALATEGIQRGHMNLHARQVAIAAGAVGDQVEKVAAQMIAEKTIRLDRATQILASFSGKVE